MVVVLFYERLKNVSGLRAGRAFGGSFLSRLRDAGFSGAARGVSVTGNSQSSDFVRHGGGVDCGGAVSAVGITAR